MKHFIRRYWLYVILLIVGFSLLIAFRDNLEEPVFLGGVATLLTLFISVINYYQSNDRFLRDLFIDFNARYDNMNDFLNSKPVIEDKLNEGERQKIVDYLILSAEEYMWVKNGRITREVWKSWRAGIVEHLQKASVRRVYEEERLSNSYYGFFQEMNKYL